jgi:hypothetical protein
MHTRAKHFILFSFVIRYFAPAGTTWETINKYCLHGAQQLPGISCYIFLVPNIFSRVDLILIRVLSR